LSALADQDANADCRQVVLDRLQEMSDDPDVRKVIDSLNIDATAEMNPAEPTNPADSESDEPVQEIKDPATQTEDPAGTPQPTYPEYAEDLSAILNIAGVPARERTAPDYEPELREENLEDETSIGGDASDAFIRDVSIDQQDEKDLDEAENLSPFTEEATCNMTEAGESCPVHGVEECWGSDASPLAGQYGHSGKMKPVDKDLSFLDRLKELSGLKRN
jgi:hypothetical protein